jgi:hypothetical protein
LALFSDDFNLRVEGLFFDERNAFWYNDASERWIIAKGSRFDRGHSIMNL